MSSEPIRLLDGLDASDVERSVLRAGRSQAPVAYDVEAGAARFRTQLAALAAAGAVTAGAGASGSSVALRGKALLSKLAFKVMIGLMAGGVFAGAGVVAGMRLARAPGRVDAALAAPKKDALVVVREPAPVPPTVAPAPSPVTSVEALPEARAVAPRAAHEVTRHPSPLAHAAGGSTPSPDLRDAVDETPPVVAQAAATSVAEARAEAPPRPAEPPVAQPSAAPKPPELLSEVRAVALARSLLERDPDAALDLLDKLHRDHPTGYFVEERQALTVLALSRAGRQSAAREQAAAFLRAYPNGPFSDRIRSVERIP